MKTENFPQLVNLYRFLCSDPDGAKGEGLYYRIVEDKSRRERCIQCILYYEKQYFPLHEGEYAPFFIYTDLEGKPIRIIYDYWHHNSKMVNVSGKTDLTVRFPWHGYDAKRYPLSKPLKTEFFDLSDEIIDKWWRRKPVKSAVKLRTKLIDPWHKGLMKSKGTFRDEGKCPDCDYTVQFDDMEIENSIIFKVLECPQHGTYKCSFNIEDHSWKEEKVIVP